MDMLHRSNNSATFYMAKFQVLIPIINISVFLDVAPCSV
jgi:hypothetical protein